MNADIVTVIVVLIDSGN